VLGKAEIAIAGVRSPHGINRNEKIRPFGRIACAMDTFNARNGSLSESQDLNGLGSQQPAPRTRDRAHSS
jgi:hypothetical protein